MLEVNIMCNRVFKAMPAVAAPAVSDFLISFHYSVQVISLASR